MTTARMRRFQAGIAGVMLASSIAFTVLISSHSDPWKATSVACYAKWDDTADPPIITCACDRVGTLVPVYYTLAMVVPSLVGSALAAVFHRQHALSIHEVAFFRWGDYVVSSSLMVFIIAVLNGERDVVSLTLLVVMQVLLIGTGAVAEFFDQLGDVLAARYALGVGGFIHVVIWAVLAVPFFLSIRGGPSWLPVVFSGLFVAFSSFGVVAVLQIEQYVTRVKAEYMYGVLGVAAKLPLQWSIYAGLVARSADQDSETMHTVAAIFAVALFSTIAAVLYIRRLPPEIMLRG